MYAINSFGIHFEQLPVASKERSTSTAAGESCGSSEGEKLEEDEEEDDEEDEDALNDDALELAAVPLLRDLAAVADAGATAEEEGNGGSNSGPAAT